MGTFRFCASLLRARPTSGVSPVQAPEFPVQAPEFSVQAPEFPVQAPEFSAQAPEFSAQAPEFPIRPMSSSPSLNPWPRPAHRLRAADRPANVSNI
ncbi:hypothetical protein Atai01_05050 [Amycolatopsis taiwanensis]|uniref:Uncharacterized protein n=1 Tax=Amycolatopsis taiwanensis TaxID=342230 RepID=A0A9W6QWE7_9PSEU|nr:hypothetical protein Atai01_05050 [Amycolatopsis taiwanensis]